MKVEIKLALEAKKYISALYRARVWTCNKESSEIKKVIDLSIFNSALRLIARTGGIRAEERWLYLILSLRSGS